MQERARHITQSRLDTKNSDGPPGKPGECKGKLAGLCTCDPFIEHSRNDAATEMEAGIRGGRGGEEPPSGVQEAVGMEQLYTGIMLAATGAMDGRQSRGTLHILVAPGRARVAPAHLTLLMPCAPGASVGHWGSHEHPRYSFL